VRLQQSAEQKGSSPTGTLTIQVDCLHDTLLRKLKDACCQIGCLRCIDMHSMNFIAAE